jgi:ubiquinone/menaquinone biosynthesis C-methylase UbiE
MTNYLEHRINFNDPAIASICDELSFWSSRFGRLLFEQVEIRRGIRILDVGCANGFPLFELAHVFGGSCELKGIDVWPEAIARARDKLKVYGLRNVEIIEADAARQPFADSTFDLIVSNLGVNNFADPPAALRECFRVAAPEARIVLTTNVNGHYREFYDVYRETLRELDKTAYLDALQAQETHRGTKESTCELLREAGFEIVKIVEDSFQMRFADADALFNHALTKLGFLEGWRGVVPAEDAPAIFATIEAKLGEIAARDGELRMTVPMLYVEGAKR